MKKRLIIAGIIIAMSLLAIFVMLTSNEGSKETKTSLVNLKDSVWINTNFSSVQLEKGEMDIQIFTNTRGVTLGSFNITVEFDKDVMIVDYNKGENGISKGVNAEGYIVLSSPVKAGIPAGEYTFAGMRSGESEAPKVDGRHIATIHMKLNKNSAREKTYMTIKEETLLDNQAQELRSFGMKKFTIFMTPRDKRINGECGERVMGALPAKDKLCKVGKVIKMNRQDRDGGIFWEWRCEGLNGGKISMLCRASTKKVVEKVDGRCTTGVEGGLPSKDSLCLTGVSTKVRETMFHSTDGSGIIIWEWTCEGVAGGRDSEKCEARHQPYVEVINGECAVVVDPHEKGVNFCKRGSVSEIAFLEGGNVQAEWTCSGIGPGNKAAKCQVLWTARCGDGKTNYEKNEECDNGIENGRKPDVRYGEVFAYCSKECKMITGSGPYCGDNNVDKNNGEECDSGPNLGIKPALEYNKPGRYCSMECKYIAVAPPHCGDGVIQAELGEECDLGSTGGAQLSFRYGDDTEITICGDDCKNKIVQGPYCGDGIIQNNEEQCDDGDVNDIKPDVKYGEVFAYCSGECKTVEGSGPYCGDRKVDRDNGEECDRGKRNGKIPIIRLGRDRRYCSIDCKKGIEKGLDIVRADVDDDRKITLIDAILVLKKSARFLLKDLIAIGWKRTPITGDINCDKEVTIVDAILILKYSAGYRENELKSMGWCVDNMDEKLNR